MVVFNNERESERVKTIHLIYASLLFLFFLRVFFKFQIHFSQKEARKQTRERVLSREGSLNVSHKEREKRERERALESDFYRAEQKERFD